MPGNRTEARSFDWIARMRHVAPEAAIIDPRALAGDPSYGLVAARMIVDQGTLSTYSLVEAENQIASIGFQPMSAAHPTAGSRAYADWVALDIPLTQEACSQGVTITARPMGVGRTRTMTLKPACSPSDSAQPSVTEIAIVNLPSWQAARRATTRYPSPLGPHFELYYKLAKTIPEPARRLVPALAADAAGVAPQTIDLERAASPLLQGLQLTDAKGTFAQPICIPVAFEAPADDG